jgi:predicted Zn-dependent peptidase
MIAYIGSQADKMNEAIVGMNELLTTMPETNQLFETAKQGIKQDIATERITKDDIVFHYLDAQKLGLDYDVRKQEYESVDNLKLENIAQYHDQNLKNMPFTYCILGSEKKITPEELAKYGEVKTLTPEEIFGF